MSSQLQTSVLVVDDSRLILEMVRDAFSEAGLAVDTAANGEEALEQALDRRPDLIVSDVLMPIMDGWALFEALQNHPEFKAVPFIFLTSEREAAKRIKGLRMGAHDYLTKPFSVEELLLRAQRILERTRPGGPDQKQFLAGHTSHLALAELIQLLSGNHRTGTLWLRGDQEARVLMREGSIVQAEVPGAEGRKALFRLLAWPDSEFSFEPSEVPAFRNEITEPTSSLVMDGLLDADEVGRFRGELPPPETPIRVRADARERVAGEGMSAIEFEVTRLAKRGLTLDGIVDQCAASDGQVLKTLHGLLGRGVLETWAGNGSGEDGESGG